MVSSVAEHEDGPPESKSAGLRGRRALVTGAASGIGLAIAERLIAEGCYILVTDRTEIYDAPLRERAALSGGAVSVVTANLADRADIARLVEMAGTVDILVNNAGLQHVSPIESFPEDRWDLLLAVMVTAPFLLTRAFLPGMYQSGWGRVINIASVHGLVASPFKSAYVSAKHAILGFTKVAALEAATHSPQVTVHAICPSYVRTPMVEAQIADQAEVHGISEDEVIERIMLAPNAIRRLIEPTEVAEAVAFLCGPAAWSMSGAPFTLDAGWLAH